MSTVSYIYCFSYQDQVNKYKRLFQNRIERLVYWGQVINLDPAFMEDADRPIMDEQAVN